MSAVQQVLQVVSWLAVAALVWRGRRVERLAAVAIVVVMVAPPLLQGLEAGNVRWALALVSLLFLLVLGALSLAADRWWLLAAAGFQLTATATYAVAAADGDILIWSGVALRRILWLQLMLVCLFGAWEARHAHTYREARALDV